MKPTMFVFEGCECAGKTSIVRRLADEFSGTIHKRVRTRHPIQTLSLVLKDIEAQSLRTSGVYAARPDTPWFFDRWQMISDIVYNELFERPSVFSPLFEAILDMCYDVGIQIIFLMIPEYEMVRRFNARGDLLVDVDEAIKAYRIYTKLIDRCYDHPAVRVINLYGAVDFDLHMFSEEEAYQKVKDHVVKELGGERIKTDGKK